MRFVIEIYVVNQDGIEDVLHRTPVERINPAASRKEVRRLFEIFKRRHGLARMINAKGEIIYTLTE